MDRPMISNAVNMIKKKEFEPGPTHFDNRDRVRNWKATIIDPTPRVRMIPPLIRTVP